MGNYYSHLVVLVLHWRPLHLLPGVLCLLLPEHALVEVVLEGLVAVVDAQLLEAVLGEVLSKNKKKTVREVNSRDSEIRQKSSCRLTSNPNMSMMAMTFLSLLTSLWPLLPRRLRFPGEEEEALGEHTLFTLATTLKKGKSV